MHASNIPEIGNISTEEKILLVEDLWDSIARDELNVPFPESHKKELNKRLRKYGSSPGDLLTLEELQAKVESRCMV